MCKKKKHYFLIQGPQAHQCREFCFFCFHFLTKYSTYAVSMFFFLPKGVTELVSLSLTVHLVLYLWRLPLFTLPLSVPPKALGGAN